MSDSERGAIFTRREVVEFMLDLAGYTPDRPLFEMSLLEPSFGDGDFLFPVVDRLLASVRNHQGRLETETIFETLRHCLRAVELHRDTYAGTSASLVSHLEKNGISPDAANALCEAWLTEGDFLLTRLEQDFDFVVGNPPYVRQERIPDALIQSYRELFSTIFDRADLYVPFIEKSLRLLKKGGTLSFICSDRWMKNRYGSKLRRFVSEGYHLHYYIDMVNTPAFNSDVIAYPAITVIRREKGSTTRLAHRPEIDAQSLGLLRDKLLDPKNLSGAVSQIAGLVQGDEPWILEASDQIALVRRLEADFPLIEDAGCRVGIGVATGADKVFIAPFDALDVEPDRKLPLVTTKDIRSGHVQWKGLGVLNPFADDGRLVDLEAYPRLKAYFEVHEDKIRRRNVAKRRPDGWYRTIDRIYPELTHKPKLLIPDIKGSAHVVYEGGELYPHHNLYYITSETWELHALQAVLLSGIARLFVATYSTIMAGGFLRFQAQYLRRIRLPRWQDVPEDTRAALIEAAREEDRSACNAAVSALYQLSEDEQAAIAADKPNRPQENLMAKKTQFVNPLFRKYPELSDGRVPTRKSSKDDQRRGALKRRLDLLDYDAKLGEELGEVWDTPEKS